jgi:AcrR family transcriptional regulator
VSTKPRREKERNRRITHIQRAVRRVFLEKGYFNTTIDEIARRAEVSKGTVYFYFKSKDELYVSLMVPVIEKLHQLLDEFEEDYLAGHYSSGSEVIGGIIEVFRQTHAYDPEALNIFQIFQLNSLLSVMSPPTQEQLRDLGRSNFSMLRRVIVSCVARGYLQDLNLNQLADLLCGAFLGLVQLEQAKMQLSRKDHLRETLRFVVPSLCAGLAATHD